MTTIHSDGYDDARVRVVKANRATLAGALKVYDALVTFAIDNADASGDIPDEWRLPRFTLRGGSTVYFIEPVSDVTEAELAAMVRACDPDRAPEGCRVNLRYRVDLPPAGATLALEVWSR